MTPAALSPFRDERRWCCWRLEARDGRPTKLPLQPNGALARSSDPATWWTLSDCEQAVAERGAEGVGIFLGPLGGGITLAGIDLDLCRSPDGTLAEWAESIVKRLNTYCEVSPSGTGLKAYGYTSTSLAQELLGEGRYGRSVTPNGAAADGCEAAGHKKPEIAYHLDRRFFVVTGEAITTRRLQPLDDGLRWLHKRMDRLTGAGRKPRAARPPKDTGELPERFVAALDSDNRLKQAWETGAKVLDNGGDASASGLDVSLACYLAQRGFTEDEIAAVARRYEHGQIGSGKLTGAAAERRLSRLLGVAKAAERPSWFADCMVGSKGRVLSNVANAAVALRSDARWKDTFAFDEMSRRVLIDGQPLCDYGAQRVHEWLQRAGLSQVSLDATHEAISLVAQETVVHPVKNYLDGLTWDGRERVDSWLADYLGAERGDYTRDVGRMLLLSAVARVYEPGCKVDHMPVFEGPQGIGKSTACQTLGGEWYSDSLQADVSRKDASLHLRGRWILELSELEALNRSEVTALKSFLTRQEERYRPPYGRHEVYEPRQCVFVGTTNESQYLKDPTGGRRFWPVACGTIHRERLAAERDQLFAEAVVAYRAGQPWWPSATWEQRHAAPEQEKRAVTDPWEEHVREHVAGKTEAKVREILEDKLGILPAHLTSREGNRVGAILHKLGWTRRHTRHGNVWIKAGE